MATVEINHLPGSEPVTKAHAGAFEAAYCHMPPSASDMAFANLIGWQKYFDYHVLQFQNLLCVHFISGKCLEFLPPQLSASCTDKEFAEQFCGFAAMAKAHCAAQGAEPVFRYFSNSVIARLADAISSVTPQRDYFDYVYGREDLVELAGEKYSPKRNLIKQFKSRYNWEYASINAQTIGRAKEYMDKRRQDTSKHLTTKEYCIGCEMLNAFDLGFLGGMLLVGGNVVALTVGSIFERFEYERAIEPTVVVHFENADLSVKGAYQMINQQFCEHLPAHIKYVNREEDLGLAGLRKAKMSYNPARFIEKSIIIPK